MQYGDTYHVDILRKVAGNVDLEGEEPLQQCDDEDDRQRCQDCCPPGPASRPPQQPVQSEQQDSCNDRADDHRDSLPDRDTQRRPLQAVRDGLDQRRRDHRPRDEPEFIAPAVDRQAAAQRCVADDTKEAGGKANGLPAEEKLPLSFAVLDPDNSERRSTNGVVARIDIGSGFGLGKAYATEYVEKICGRLAADLSSGRLRNRRKIDQRFHLLGEEFNSRCMLYVPLLEVGFERVFELPRETIECSNRIPGAIGQYRYEFPALDSFLSDRADWYPTQDENACCQHPVGVSERPHLTVTFDHPRTPIGLRAECAQPRLPGHTLCVQRGLAS
ncbi:hypothetical protein [Mesorhizobium sp. L-8-3]|uniref:hypothetical protein n=1 Tax=Mesorhizobium sp. L-8-3 TaxID=2744522 RepID=UPI001925F213|nr:hypothetical protein [Mesorhizobium sp. L-8-3]